MAYATKSLVSTKSFNLRYTFLPMVSLNASIARNVYHPLHAKTIERQKEEERPQLIIDIMATIKRTSPKAVVRNRSRRRVREATYQVLKENGYGKDGKAEDGGKKDLVGTLAFFTTTETVLTPWEELKAEVRYGVVKWIALRQSNSRTERNTGREDARPRHGEEHTAKEHTAYQGEGESGEGYQRGARQAPWRREDRGGGEGYRRQEPWGGGEGEGGGGGGSQGGARQEPWRREEREGRGGHQRGGREGYRGRASEGVRVKADGGGSGNVGTGPGEYPRGINRQTFGGERRYQRGEREGIDARAGGNSRGASGDRGAGPGEYPRVTGLESREGRWEGKGGEGRGGGRTEGARGMGDERRDAKEYLYRPDSNLHHAGGGNGGKEGSSAGGPVENTGHVRFRVKNPAHRRF